MNILQKLALTLVIIGAINWGLVGILEFDLVAYIFGGATTFLAKTVYILVAIAGLINIYLFTKDLD